MIPNEKLNIENQIIEKIEKLETEIITLKDLTQPISPDSAIGRVSRMDAINNKSVNEAALRKKQTQLIALKKTVKNLDDPNFGKCIKCGEEIPIGRIMIMPESKKCVRCASKQ
jgi:DnaK suppressor protein